MDKATEQFLREGLLRFGEALSTVEAYQNAAKAKVEEVMRGRVATSKIHQIAYGVRGAGREAIGVELEGKLPVRGLDLRDRCTWFQAEDGKVVRQRGGRRRAV